MKICYAALAALLSTPVFYGAGIAAVSFPLSGFVLDKDTLTPVSAAAAPFFEFPVVPPPQPVPMPGVADLHSDQLFVVRSRGEAIVRPHPAGLVTITREEVKAGETLRIRGIFIGNAKTTTRTYTGPCFLYQVEPVPGAKGTVEIDFIPLGIKTESEIGAIAVAINGAIPPGPIPPGPIPPGPIPPGPIPPGPIPPNPVPPNVVYPDAGFIVVEETSQRTPAIALTLDFREWDKLPIEKRYRFYDKDSPDAISKGYAKIAADSGRPLPVVIALKADGTVIETAALPADIAGVQLWVKKITGK